MGNCIACLEAHVQYNFLENLLEKIWLRLYFAFCYIFYINLSINKEPINSPVANVNHSQRLILVKNKYLLSTLLY